MPSIETNWNRELFGLIAFSAPLRSHAQRWRSKNGRQFSIKHPESLKMLHEATQSEFERLSSKISRSLAALDGTSASHH